VQIRAMAPHRRDQWDLRLACLQATASYHVRAGDFVMAAKALRISRRAYDRWGRETFNAKPDLSRVAAAAIAAHFSTGSPGGKHLEKLIPSIESSRDLANAFRL
jgi:hypothetical protein